MMAASLMNSTMAIDTGQDALENGAFMIDQSVLADRNYLDMSELLQVPKHSQPTVSGKMDFDYPSLADPKIGLSSVSEVGSIKKIPLPAELVEQFGHMQCNCIMGLFPEITRAWLSIDSDIFVWNYEDGSDLAYFDGLGETILSTALVKPKPAIFQPHIQYLLCLTTPVDIVLLGVSFSKPHDATDVMSIGEMHLLPEPLFSIPTDNVHFLSVAGTATGRIFMAGKDGCLYELTYQAEDGWFSRKCRKINHSTSKLSFMLPSFLNFSFIEDDSLVQLVVDDSRNILYTRSDKGTLQRNLVPPIRLKIRPRATDISFDSVFDLGEDGKGMCRVAAISQQTMVQNAALVARTIDKATFSPIVHIAATPKTDSANVHLVAITHSGIRLYFTTSPFSDNRGRPCMLTLVHVRLPPGFCMSSSIHKPSKVHAAHYHRGTLLMVASQSEDNDLLWIISNDSFPFQKQLRETYECTVLDGKTWALAEVPVGGGVEGEDSQPYSPIQPPSVVTQHMEAERRFVLINSQGSYVITKHRPLDQLRHLLLTYSPDSDEVMSFFQLHKEQACATCLLLACSQQLVEHRVSEMATRAFFLYGGEPESSLTSGVPATTLGPTIPTSPGMSYLAGPSSLGGPGVVQTPAHGMHPNQMSTPFPHVAQQLSFQSHNATAMATPGGADVRFSWRHNGVCLFIGRILRRLWDSPMVAEFQPPTGGKRYLCSAFNSEEMSFVLARLLSLREFMAKNSQFASYLVAESYTAAHLQNASRSVLSARNDSIVDEQARRKYQAEAESQEAASLRKIHELVNRTCECLGLWRILCDHQFHVIAGCLSKDQQNALKSLTFKNFVIVGKDLSSYLITSLINMYIDDNAATDAISERLRDVCPALYSMEDAVCSKGTEKLQTARSVQNSQERERQLQDALTMYKQVTQQLDLPVVCNQFANARFYKGIVDLSLTAAVKRDPQGLALHYYKNGEPLEDTQGLYFYAARMDCYKCISETLDFLLCTSMSHPQSPSVPKAPGPPPPVDPNRLTNTEAERYAEEVFSLALETNDEMFHVSLYEWLIAKKLSDKLLEIQSPFLEPFLKRAAQVHQEQLAYLDLLWKYYEKSKNYSAASRILAKLADRHGNDQNLSQRMEYLSRAAICAKSSTMRTSAGSEGEFLHDLEEKMEVARIQLQVYEALSKLPPSGEVEQALGRLNSQLMDITELYGEFAEQFELAECKLAIIHCAGHYDPTLVETLWQDIIDKELRSNKDPNTAMTTLSNKLVKLGRMYGGSERYLPIAFLVKYLERVSCEHNFTSVNTLFVCSILMEVGITVPRLHEMYDRLFKSKDSCWKTLRKPYHLLFVIHDLLNGFAMRPNSVPAFEKRLFTTTCLDSIANYLVELHAESTMNETVCQLKNRFKDLQAKLERIV